MFFLSFIIDFIFYYCIIVVNLLCFISLYDREKDSSMGYEDM
jgi:hypothetical protein